MYSGTSEFLHTNPEFVEDQSQVEEVACNKDTGGLKAFHSWSRGVFFIVSLEDRTNIGNCFTDMCIVYMYVRLRFYL